MNAAPAPEPQAPRVMLLSLSAATGTEWHARLVDADATVHDFDSPFELARFLATGFVRLPPGPPGGLR